MPTDAFFLYLGFSLFLQFTSESSLESRVSFSRLKKLRIESIPKTPLPRVTGRPRAGVLYRLQIVPRVSIKCDGGCRLAAGFDLAPFRKKVTERRTFFPKTTVPWHEGKNFVVFELFFYSPLP